MIETETEKAKMLRGVLYDSSDATLTAERRRARELLHRLNVFLPGVPSTSATEVLRQLLPNAASLPSVQPPFYCDYGYNIHLGPGVFLNFNCLILDAARVTIGARTQFGPNVQIYAATHPLDAVERRSGLESALPVSIGEDCWIGGSAVICPGVTIGDRCVIGAGSVVTRDIPDDTLAVGNPARPARRLSASAETGGRS